MVELFSRLATNENQLTYYDSGIATYVAESGFFARVKQRVVHWMDMAFALCVSFCIIMSNTY